MAKGLTPLERAVWAAAFTDALEKDCAAEGPGLDRDDISPFYPAECADFAVSKLRELKDDPRFEQLSSDTIREIKDPDEAGG